MRCKSESSARPARTATRVGRPPPGSNRRDAPTTTAASKERERSAYFSLVNAASDAGSSRHPDQRQGEQGKRGRGYPIEPVSKGVYLAPSFRARMGQRAGHELLEP